MSASPVTTRKSTGGALYRGWVWDCKCGRGGGTYETARAARSAGLVHRREGKCTA